MIRGNVPTYYFVINSKSIPDTEEGEILHSDDAAWHEATLVAGEIFKDVDGDFRPGQQWKLEVQDAHRRPLFSISVTSAKSKQ
jgi:hypothetical protein